MSYYGRQCIRAMDRLEAEGQWWQDYADRLTPKERQRLRDGNYSALKRPLLPAFRKGQRVEPMQGLTLEVDSIQPRRGGYLVRFGRIEDFRNRRALDRPIKDDPELVTTLCLTNPAARQAEPGRIDKAAEDQITERSSIEENQRIRLHWAKKRAEIAQSIADLRELGIHDRELWIMERRMDKLDEKLNKA